MGWISAIGDVAGGILGMAGAAGANKTNAAINASNQQWMTQMSDTAMQRRVTDLRAAGLNPLLAVSQGGASTPGMSPIPMGNTMSPVGQGLSAAGNAVMQQAQVDQIRADAAQKAASAQQIASNTPDNVDMARNNLTYVSTANAQEAIRRADLAGLNVEQAGKQLDLTDAQTAQLEAQLPGTLARSSIERMDAATQAALMNTFISMAKKQQAAAGANAQNQADFQNSGWGRLLNKLGFGPSGNAGGAVSSAATAAKAGALFME